MAKASPVAKAARANARGGVASLREEHKRVTRDRIIAATEALFQEQGFRATTVEQIAKMAGTTVTTFYRHFTSKSELARIMEEKLSVDVLEALRKLEALRNPTRKALRAWFNQYYEMWQRICLLSEAYWEATAADDEFAAGILASTMRLTSHLTELLERIPANIRPRMQLRLSLLVIVMDRIAFLVKSEKHDPQRSAIFDEFAEVFYNGFFPLDGSK